MHGGQFTITSLQPDSVCRGTWGSGQRSQSELLFLITRPLLPALVILDQPKERFCLQSYPIPSVWVLLGCCDKVPQCGGLGTGDQGVWPLCLHSGITFILDRFEGRNSVIRVQTRLSLDKALSQVADHTQPSSHVSLQGRKGEKALWGPFYKGSCLHSQNSECGKM